MRVAISNIAWDVGEDSAVAHLLGGYGIDAIDVAPGKYFPDPGVATDIEIAEVRAWWAARGISITGMQALLFGTVGLNVFGDEASVNALLLRLGAVCRIGSGLGATRLVFGSPKNRDRSGLPEELVQARALEFFTELGGLAESSGVVVCLEPNPPAYGANFMTTSLETAAVVRAVGHRAIRMQLDTGAITMNGEDVDAVVRECAEIIGHIHASEPNLVPLGEGGCDHERAGAAVARHIPDRVVTIEMVGTSDEPHLQAIERALGVANRYYGQAIMGATP
jgi:sugar phosphate isomerase/epimerase